MRTLTNLVLVAILGLSAKTAFDNISGTPAFNANLRVPNVFGDEQSILSSAMYNYPDYLLQIGTSYLRADLLPSADTEASGEYASTELAMRRADLAVGVLEESLALDPANALAWESLAWGRLMSGDVDGARAALDASWDLAPYNRQLANLRLTLGDALFAGIGEEITPTEKEKAALERDLQTLELNAPSDFRFHAENEDS